MIVPYLHSVETRLPLEDLKLNVYVGDTRVDIRAGNAAGMKTVGVLTGFDDYDALKNELPDAIIDSIAQLCETLVIRSDP